MARRRTKALWPLALQRSVRLFGSAMQKVARKTLKSAVKTAVKTATAARRRSLPPADLAPGAALGPTGVRNYLFYQPTDLERGERVPLIVMLHGCGQDAAGFARSTRMNSVARKNRFCVLYPEQDRLANAQGCWNWFETKTGRAQAEIASLMLAIDQVIALHPIARDQVAIAGLSAGASMAALVASRHPDRFKAVIMHSGVHPGAAHSALSALGAMRGHRAPQVDLSARSAAAAQKTKRGSAIRTGQSPSTPVAEPWPPLLVIQGSQDHVVNTSNGLAAAKFWALQSGASPGKPRRVQRGQRYATVVTDFRHGKHTAVTLCEVDSLGHAWSGGQASLPFGDPQGPDSSTMTAAFLQRQLRALGIVGR